MLPVMLDPARVKVALVGDGDQALSRLRLLRAHGARPAAVYAPEPSVDLAAEAGGLIIRRLPRADEIAAVDVLFIGDLDEAQAQSLAQDARSAKTLVNVQDARTVSDFHMPAAMRRGALLITVSTDGASPGLSRRLAAHLADAFGEEWTERVSEISRARERWRAAGMSMRDLSHETDRYIDEKGWLT